MITWEPWVILAVSLGTSLVVEGVSYYFVYRLPRYQRLKAHVERTAKQLEKMQREAPSVSVGSKKNEKKKTTKMDKDLKDSLKELTVSKMRVQMILTLLTLGFQYLVHRCMGPVPVAKLPFIPLPFFHGLSHRNLPGKDMTDCSAAFLLLLSSLATRGTLPKLCGSELHRSIANKNVMFPEMPQEDE